MLEKTLPFFSRLIKNTPLILVLVMAFNPMAKAMVEHINYKENKQNYLITADQFILSWNKIKRIGYDFEVSSTTGLDFCNTGQCPQNLVDKGAQFYKVYEVPGKGRYIAYYDANGKLLGAGFYISEASLASLSDCTFAICSLADRAAGIQYYTHYTLDNGKQLRAFYDKDGKLIRHAEVAPSAPDSGSPVAASELATTPETATLAGNLGGSFSVNAYGASVYSIPLDLPPGVNGLQPNLALTYNNQAGNGWLGKGWALSGLSQIQRCPQTIAIDGLAKSVTYTDSDRLCLNGQRLINITGAYWAAGTIYHTEIDSLSRVTQNGTGDQASFTVKTKSGLTYHYASAFKALDPTNYSNSYGAPYVWSVTTVKDEFNNEMRYSYDKTQHQPILEKIEYGAANVADAVKVHFVSGNRTDQTVSYKAGGAYRLTKALMSIEVYAQGKSAYEYKVGYGSVPYSSTTKKPVVKFIQKCGFEGSVKKCLKENSFIQKNQTNLIPNSFDTLQGTVKSSTQKSYVTDYDGDGLQDIFSIENLHGSGQTTKIKVALNKGNSVFQEQELLTTNSPIHAYNPVALDVDGDGDKEFAYLSQDTSVSSGEQFQWVINGGHLGLREKFTSILYPTVVDINFDGKDDLLIFKGDSWYLNISGQGLYNLGIDATLAQSIVPLGVMSNGEYGFILHDANNYHLGLYSSSSKTVSTSALSIAFPRSQVLDMNGDGLLDIVSIDSSANTVNLHMATGSTNTPFVKKTLSNSTDVLPLYYVRNSIADYPVKVIDYNGDGYQDLLYPNANSYAVLKSTGDGFEGQIVQLGIERRANINMGSPASTSTTETHVYGWLAPIDGAYAIDTCIAAVGCFPINGGIRKAGDLIWHRQPYSTGIDFFTGQPTESLLKATVTGYQDLSSGSPQQVGPLNPTEVSLRPATSGLQEDPTDAAYPNPFSCPAGQVSEKYRSMAYSNQSSCGTRGDVEATICPLISSFESKIAQVTNPKSREFEFYYKLLNEITLANATDQLTEFVSNITGVKIKVISTKIVDGVQIPDKLEPERPFNSNDLTIAFNMITLLWGHAACGVKVKPLGTYLVTGGQLRKTTTHYHNHSPVPGTGHKDMLVLDVNGDGQQDFLQLGSSPTTWGAHIQQRTTYPDQIEKYTDSLGKETTVVYASGADTSVYKGHSGTPVYPTRNLGRRESLVKSVSVSNGLKDAQGNKLTSSMAYAYKGRKLSLDGRGYLGFEEMLSTDSQTNIQTSTKKRQDFPFIGRAKEVTAKQNGGAGSALSLSTYTWNSKNLNTGKTKFPYVENVTSNVYELDGKLVSSEQVTATYSDDNYANIESKTTVLSGNTEEHRLVETFAYSDAQTGCAQNPTNWFLGFVCKKTEQSTVDNVSRTIVNKYTPWSTSHKVGVAIMHAGSNKLERVNISTYDVNGNLRTQAAATGSSVIDNDRKVIGRTVLTNDNYQDHRYPKSIMNAKTQYVTAVYDERFGLPLRQNDLNDHVTTLSYDALGRQVQRLEWATSNQTDTQYQTCVGSVCSHSDAIYKVTRTVTNSSTNVEPTQISYYDLLDRVVRQETVGFDGTAIYVDTTYDERGNIKTVSEPYYVGQTAYKTENTTIDILGRVTQVDSPDGGKVVTAYEGQDSGGRKVTKTITVKGKNADGSNKVEVTQEIVRIENALGQFNSVTDALGKKVEYNYDPLGNLIFSRVALNDKTDVTATYDNAGNKIEMKDPDTGRYLYTYDVLGNLRKQTDAAGQYMVMEYDTLDRMVKREDFLVGGTSEGVSKWVYDTANKGVGLLHCVADKDIANCDGATATNNFKETHVYDDKSRLLSTTTQIDPAGDNKTYTVSNTYDKGRVNIVTYPSGFKVKNHYNAYGYLNKQTDKDGNTNYQVINEMTPRAQLQKATLGNSQVTQWGYRAENGRISSITTEKADNSHTAQKLSYHFDTAGNLDWRKDSRNSAAVIAEAFTYDKLNRLASSKLGAGALQEYKYDIVGLGNLTQKPGVSGAIAYYNGSETAEDAGGIHAVNTANGFTYGYDKNGNVKTVKNSANTVVRTVGYGVLNKPIRIEGNGTVNTFKYSPDRSRYYQAKTTGGATTKTYYAMGGAFEEVVEGGTSKLRTYIGDYLIHTKVGATATVQYTHRDHLGSVDVITNADASVAQQLSFAAFGERRDGADWDGATTVDTSNTTRGFTDHEHLDDVGLIHMNGRVYDPVIGRFLSPDIVIQFPEFSQSYNRYSYVLNNPLSFNDPTGYVLTPIAEEVLADVGGSIFSPAELEFLESMSISGFELGASGSTALTAASSSKYLTGVGLLLHSDGLNVEPMLSASQIQFEAKTMDLIQEFKTVRGADRPPILFGQRRAGPTFSGGQTVPRELREKTLRSVAKKISLVSDFAAFISLGVYADPRCYCQLISTNTRGLTVLSMAGVDPVFLRPVLPTRAEIARLSEPPVFAGQLIPGPRVAVTPTQSDLRIMAIISRPGFGYPSVDLSQSVLPFK